MARYKPLKPSPVLGREDYRSINSILAQSERQERITVDSPLEIINNAGNPHIRLAKRFPFWGLLTSKSLIGRGSSASGSGGGGGSSSGSSSSSGICGTWHYKITEIQMDGGSIAAEILDMGWCGFEVNNTELEEGLVYQWNANRGNEYYTIWCCGQQMMLCSSSSSSGSSSSGSSSGSSSSGSLSSQSQTGSSQGSSQSGSTSGTGSSVSGSQSGSPGSGGSDSTTSGEASHSSSNLGGL